MTGRTKSIKTSSSLMLIEINHKNIPNIEILMKKTVILGMKIKYKENSKGGYCSEGGHWYSGRWT